MEYVSISLSAIALGLSVFTFYWVQLRVSDRLHLVRIDKLGEFKNPMFALVNNGTRDILITSVQGRFQHADYNSGTYFSQRLETTDGSSMLLSAGKAMECRVIFQEMPTGNFVNKGKPREGSVPPVYEFEFDVEVNWVDASAHSHSGQARIAKYGFSEDAKMMMFSPLEAKHDLYGKP
ncbi:hypothetical protein [Halomonas sp. Mc5H-6]|uniref:hypothetical protein n=1 Tax=Halomonas sp. Mc5H-6 TaxID=2954500 RepID=UPI002096B62C|nr:hypothetical protein [Halomonas sp. Mc5H-6]MCO7247528.1 hypothetical protein [Halomonas sp. Mc5H-6]